MRILFLVIVGFALGCERYTGKTTPDIHKTDGKPNVQRQGSLGPNTIGVVTLGDNYDKYDTIKLFNKDGSLWYKLSYFYDDSDGKFEYGNTDFRPLAFHPDKFVLALGVVNQSQNEYEVVVNKETSATKLIKREPFLRFLTWEEYVAQAFSVSFDSELNPILLEPKESGAAVLSYAPDVLYHPVEVKDEWLKVEWQVGDSWKNGWIKWKVKNKLIIDIHQN